MRRGGAQVARLARQLAERRVERIVPRERGVAAERRQRAQAGPRAKVTVTKKYTGTRGYGFLPGYEPPQVTRRESYGKSPWVQDSTWPWYGWPQFYRGRWNGGSFGPCWTSTPIGMMWNCGQ